MALVTNRVRASLLQRRSNRRLAVRVGEVNAQPTRPRGATLDDVIDHCNTFFGLGLTDQQKRDLIEHLKSL